MTAIPDGLKTSDISKWLLGALLTLALTLLGWTMRAYTDDMDRIEKVQTKHEVRLDSLEAACRSAEVLDAEILRRLGRIEDKIDRYHSE